jgi:hypothetical protein
MSADIWADLSRMAEITDKDEIKTIIIRRVGCFLEDIHRIAVAVERLEDSNRKSMYDRYSRGVK